MENAAILGLPIPEQLKKVLKQIKNRGGDEKQTETKKTRGKKQ